MESGMSKIDNPTIKKNEQPLPEETAFHVEHKGEPTNKTTQSAPEIDSTSLLSRSVGGTTKPSTDSLCTKAHALRANGEIAKAYLAYKEAADQGSIEAKFWLGEVDRPFGQEQTSETKIQKPAIQVRIEPSTHSVTAFSKFSEILHRLHALNPEEYDSETIDKIEHELKEGHCNGFALYYVQLALIKNPGSSFDRTEELAILVQKFADWDGELFEPPQGFSYERDYEKLTDEEKKNLTFTNELKEFISIIRFGQHVYHEDIEDEKSQSPRLGNTGRSTSPFMKEFNPEDAFFHLFESSLRQMNFDFILGDKYETKMKLQAFTPSFSINAFIKTLKTYLTETNAAHFAIKTSEMHAISIIYREGKYYLYDVNSDFEGDNFDPRYSARSYDTLEALNQDIQSVYKAYINPNSFKASDILGPENVSYMTIIERKGAQNFYLSEKEEYERLDIIKLNDLSKRIPADQFNQLLNLSLETEPYDLDLQSMNSNLYALLPAFFFKNAKAIRHSASDRESYRFLSQAAPLGQFEGGDFFGFKKNALNDLGNLYATPFSALYDAQKAFRFFQLAAEKGGTDPLYNLAICYYLGFGTDKNEELGITYLLKAADKEHPSAINMIGYLFNEQEQILNNPHFMKYLETASSQNVANASYNLGMIYLAGLFGQTKDVTKARRYFQDQELSKNPDALLALSHIYLHELDSLEYMGIHYLQQAADLGSLVAQWSYGNHLIKSNTENDPEVIDEAMYYFQLAADQGDSNAQLHLGAYLYNQSDSDEAQDFALYYLKLAAEQGNEEALAFLAEIPTDESDQ